MSTTVLWTTLLGAKVAVHVHHQHMRARVSTHSTVQAPGGTLRSVANAHMVRAMARPPNAAAAPSLRSSCVRVARKNAVNHGPGGR